MAFATVSDVVARWRDLTSDEQDKAEVLIEDASVMLSALVSVDPSDQQQAALLKRVCCSMVIRAMIASASDALGVSQVSASVGPFDQTAHFANPNGDLYLTRQERKILGVGAGKGRILYPAYGVVSDA